MIVETVAGFGAGRRCAEIEDGGDGRFHYNSLSL